jgi:hypothetical protein
VQLIVLRVLFTMVSCCLLIVCFAAENIYPELPPVLIYDVVYHGEFLLLLPADFC